MLYPFLETAYAHPFTRTDLPLPGKRSGKVRDIYSLAGERLLLVTTDRLSAFDRILGAAPYKGQVLNQLAAWWFDQTKDIIPNPLHSLPDPNAAIMQQARSFPVEVIVRGFITGVTSTALWYRYSLGERDIYGYTFSDGLRKNQALPEPILTPTTKGEGGAHDERLTCTEVVSKGYLDATTWEQVSTAALAIFKRGQEVARRAGLVLVDTKYEFGRLPDGTVVLIDEVHTPDSSRFWLGDSYEARFAAGEEPENYDKEFIRLEYARQGYRGEGEPPTMPAELWLRVGERYVNLYERLTGQTFAPGAYPVEPRLVQNLANVK
ncbi:MAG: phosphoribosylaminoimidazolesuccinocarboxamide synthase [Chloroflexota bacterium]